MRIVRHSAPICNNNMHAIYAIVVVLQLWWLIRVETLLNICTITKYEDRDGVRCTVKPAFFKAYKRCSNAPVVPTLDIRESFGEHVFICERECKFTSGFILVYYEVSWIVICTETTTIGYYPEKFPFLRTHLFRMFKWFAAELYRPAPRKFIIPTVPWYAICNETVYEKTPL